MSISDGTVSYCEYCKGVLLTEKELELHAHQSCLDSINDFHNSLTSNIEYFRLDLDEYNAILQLEQLNSYLSDESIESGTKVLDTSLYNNRISSISLNLEHVFNLKDIKIPDFRVIFENFPSLLSLSVKNADWKFIDSILQISNRIFFLNLSNNNLDKIPIALYKIRSLRILNLSDNLLTELPLNLNNFTLLNSLHLSNNKLDRIPRFIMNFKKLKNLRINGNNISAFPQTIMYLKCLTDLDISNNSITSIPLNIKFLTSLSTLNASNNQIKVVSDSFHDLTNLKMVDLSNNQLSSIPKTLLQNDKIFSLNLSQNKIKSINKLPYSLNSLNLSNNDLTYLPETLFTKLTNLTNINLANNNLQTVPQTLLNLPNLRYLKISGNPIAKNLVSRNSILVV